MYESNLNNLSSSTISKNRSLQFFLKVQGWHMTLHHLLSLRLGRTSPKQINTTNKNKHDFTKQNRSLSKNRVRNLHSRCQRSFYPRLSARVIPIPRICSPISLQRIHLPKKTVLSIKMTITIFNSSHSKTPWRQYERWKTRRPRLKSLLTILSRNPLRKKRK